MSTSAVGPSAWPVSAQGQGGRQVRTEPDQLFDHYAVEFSFPDGTRLMAQGRLIAGAGIMPACRPGTKGSADRRRGPASPPLQGLHADASEHLGLQRTARQSLSGRARPAVRGHPRRQAVQRNRSLRKAAMVGILGRMAAESGKMVTWDEAMASKLELAPDSLVTQWIHATRRSCRTPTAVIHRHAGDDEGVLVGHKASKRVARCQAHYRHGLTSPFPRDNRRNHDWSNDHAGRPLCEPSCLRGKSV